MCPCGVEAAFKIDLRGESPKDVVDLELALRHPPNLTLSDFCCKVSQHWWASGHLYEGRQLFSADTMACGERPHNRHPCGMAGVVITLKWQG